MKPLSLLLLVAFFAFSCSLLDDDDETPKLDSAEFYETGDPTYPVIAVDETQTTFGFSQNLDQIFVEQSNGDQWMVEIASNGYPESMFIKKGSTDLLLLFSEFDSDLCNVAVINQTQGTTEYFYNIEFTDISRTSGVYAMLQNNLKSYEEVSVDIMGWWNTYGEAVKKMAGPVLGGIGCGVSALTATASGGIATPIAILSCGSFASSIAGDIIGEESTAGGAMFKGGAVVGKYGEMVLKCGTQNWGSCALAICGEAGAIANLFKYGMEKNATEEAKEHLTAYTKTDGLAGTWVSEEIIISGGSYSAEYYFGLNAGRYTQINNQTGGGAEITTKTKLDFSYTVANGSITQTMTRVEIESSGTQAGQSFSQKLGPWTWEEFLQTAQFGTMGYDAAKTTSISYELKDNGQKLVLGNGQVFTRK